MVTVLVVDDDVQMCSYVSEALEHAGYESMTAYDGLLGLEIAKEYLPDVIISDLNMPNLNGYQLLERLRHYPPTKTIPVILLTAENTTPAMRKGMLGGAEDYLPKPVSAHDILSSVKVQLQKRAALTEQHSNTLRLLRKNIIYALPHELRTPLTLISGFAHILEMDQGKNKPEEVLQFARSIISASTRLERLIENYLIYAQLELINSDPEELKAARNHVVKDSAVIIEATARDKAQEYNRPDDLNLDLCQVAFRISEDNLKKIMFELVDNAFKFSPAGSKVRVKSTRDGDTLVLYIHNMGRTMTPEQILMMGAYMQFGRELYEQQGVGFGFIVAKRLVELHEGRIKIESRPNRGTLVTIRFSIYS